MLGSPLRARGLAPGFYLRCPPVGAAPRIRILIAILTIGGKIRTRKIIFIAAIAAMFTAISIVESHYSLEDHVT